MSKKAYKVILVGPQSTGKSSILNRLNDKKFELNCTSTVGVDFKNIDFDIGDRMCTLQIWDTAGQEKFRSLTASYYKGSHACICVFDLNNLETLEKC